MLSLTFNQIYTLQFCYRLDGTMSKHRMSFSGLLYLLIELSCIKRVSSNRFDGTKSTIIYVCRWRNNYLANITLMCDMIGALLRLIVRFCHQSLFIWIVCIDFLVAWRVSFFCCGSDSCFESYWFAAMRRHSIIVLATLFWIAHISILHPRSDMMTRINHVFLKIWWRKSILFHMSISFNCSVHTGRTFVARTCHLISS